jgi:hypothetical protein
MSLERGTGGEDRSQHGLELGPCNGRVRHTHYTEARSLEHVRARGIVCSLGRTVVRVTLELQHEPLGGAVEVDDEAAEDVLATKFEPQYAAVA